MILALPDPPPHQSDCREGTGKRALRTAVLLLCRVRRAASKDVEMMRSAQVAWECAALGESVEARIAAGLVLTQTQLALGLYPAAAATAQRVQRLARGTPQWLAATVRAMAIGARASRMLGRHCDAEHLAGPIRTLVETCADQEERRRLRKLVTENTVGQGVDDCAADTRPSSSLSPGGPP